MRVRMSSLPVPSVTVAGVLAATVFSAPQNASALRTYQCQHPTTTGQEAFKLRNVSPKTACNAVRALARYVENGARGDKLYRCVGLTANHPGKPVLKIHRLAGWSLRIDHEYEFVMYRAHSSFSVTGTDFPLNCT
jgi:hypothetical protein